MWLCLLTPIVIYFLLIKIYAVNIPYVDDHALKGFILKYFSTQQFTNRIKAIFEQHNEHRIGLTRVLLLLFYYLNNEIDYRWLIWIGNGFLMGILYLYGRYFQLKKIAFYYLIPISWVLFNLENQENTFWGMASVQNFGVLFFCLLAFLQLEQKQYILTAISLTIAVFTSGNGLFALCIVCFMVLFQQQWRVLISMVLLGMVLGIIYFGDYHAPPATPTARLADAPDVMKATFAFWGSYIDFSQESPLEFRKIKTIFLGIFLFLGVSLCVLMNVSYSQKQHKIGLTPSFSVFIMATFMLIFMSSLIVVYSRIVGYGYPTILTSRYKIYSILLLITLYVWAITVLQEKYKKVLLIVFSFFSIVGFFNSLYANLNPIDYHYKTLITNAFNWSSSTKKNVPTGYNYTIPSSILNQVKLDSSVNSTASKFVFDKVIIDENTIDVQGKLDEEFIKPSDGIYLMVQSNQKIYLFPTHCTSTGIRKMITKRQYWSGNFRVSIPKVELEAGKYQMGLISIKDHQTVSYKTETSFVVLANNKKPIKTNW